MTDKKRKSLSKKTRFEVFKRDKFMCQYCGAASPDVVLHVDHIKPVKSGGDNTMLNLVTACAGCNSGKGWHELSDDSAVKVQRAALAEIQERRNQIELQRIWRDQLAEFRAEGIEDVSQMFTNFCPGRALSEYGKAQVGKYLDRFGESLVIHCAEIAFEKYLVFRGGRVFLPSIEDAIKKIGGICYNKQRLGEDG